MKKRTKNDETTAASPTPESAIYQAADGAIALRGDFARETVWATQAQIGRIFGISQSVVARHTRNVFKDKEVSRNINMQKMHINPRGQPAWGYSLDVILAVGYRTNSARAIRFRRWANDVLKQYLAQGYAINQTRLAESSAHLLYLVAKDHPFVDGNKRAAAFALLSYCRCAGIVAPDPVALAALALFVAESDPTRKAAVVGVIAVLIGR